MEMSEYKYNPLQEFIEVDYFMLKTSDTKDSKKTWRSICKYDAPMAWNYRRTIRAEARAAQLQAERDELARKLEQAQGLLSGALDSILQYRINKAWHEHFSFDSDDAKQYVNDNPTELETALREAMK
jgi:hypothetical protein